MKCSHCDVPNAPHQWTLTACANKRKRHVGRLCDACDLALNRHTLNYFNVPETEKLLTEYKSALEKD